MVRWTGTFRLTIIALSCLETAMNIGDWLRGLGLGQYEAAFRENSIDWEILRKLTSEGLKELLK